jgi:hypothetical protein
MILRKFEANHKDKKFIIEESLPDVGFYLYVYDNDSCTHDDLQDTIEYCKEDAL